MTKKRVVITILSIFAIMSIAGLVSGIALSKDNKKVMRHNQIETVTYWTSDPEATTTIRSSYLYRIEKVLMYKSLDGTQIEDITDDITLIYSNIYQTKYYQYKEVIVNPTFINFDLLTDIYKVHNADEFYSTKFNDCQVYFQVYLTPIKNCDIKIDYVSNQHARISYPKYYDTYETITVPQNQITLIKHY